MFFKIGDPRKFCNIHNKTPVLDCLFKKVTGFATFVKKILQHRRSPKKTAKFLRAHFL